MQIERLGLRLCEWTAAEQEAVQLEACCWNVCGQGSKKSEISFAFHLWLDLFEHSNSSHQFRGLSYRQQVDQSAGFYWHANQCCYATVT